MRYIPHTLRILTLAAVATVALAETDLEVTYIERTPKYFSYQDHVQYYINHTFNDDYLPYSIDIAYGLWGQNQNTKRWPDAGETVTFTAYVLNRGTTTVSSFAYTWYLDGAFWASGTYSTSLAPGAVAAISRNWAWDFAPHTVKLAVTLASDGHPSNNAVEDFTHGLSLFTFIDKGYAAAFKANTVNYPQADTDSLTEWLQRHRARMNQMFADAGSPLRWRYDRLELLNDGAPTPPYDRANYDGNFPTRYYAGDGDARLSGYYDASEDIDFGLLHEIAHQLGIIDIYRINVSPQQNLVNGAGYNSTPCLMNGVSHFISPHTALAMGAWHGKRRGYFGQYLFATPDNIRLRFLSNNGQPLNGAAVRVYQKIESSGVGERIPNAVKFSGTTDASGYYTLPNVPVDDSLFWADTGDVLKPNPFGYLSNHGENGVFLIKVEANEFVDYVWFDITEANVAYWSGQTGTATFDRQTAIGDGVQNFPPPDLAENNAASWAKWAQDGALTLSDDAAFKQYGDASLRIDATGGFDNYVRYPGDTLAKWDLSAVQQIRLWAYAENENWPGFQELSPWVRLGHYQDGYFQWKPTSDILNNSIGHWVEFVIPIAGNGTWQKTTSGAPSLSEINYFELHADTWGAGFVLWLDGVRFEPSPRPDPGDMNCDGSVNGFDVDGFVLALSDAAGYATAYPDCDITLADCNADGSVNGFDVDPFVGLLGGGAPRP
ncbi:MAG: hypothetical protein CHACPFDD_02627 [Phycisphaerae bacterium]|nr:hypothetical protein [Phycisphaerae bacterium]